MVPTKGSYEHNIHPFHSENIIFSNRSLKLLNSLKRPEQTLGVSPGGEIFFLLRSTVRMSCREDIFNMTVRVR